MKNKIIIYFLISSISLCILPELYAQNGKLIGLTNNTLVEIDQSTGQLTTITTTDIPTNTAIDNLAYVPEDCTFYAILNGSSAPALVSIDFQGNYTVIGPLSIPNGNVFLCEGLAHNSVDGKLYAGVSLNGGIPNNDYSSESIVEVDPTTASVSLISTLAPFGFEEGDIDDMAFIGNILFFHDGRPGPNISDFYRLDFTGMGTIANPIEITTGPYNPNRDIASIGDILYIPTSDLEYFQLDTNTDNFVYVGQSHAFPDYNGQPIRGLDYVESLDTNLLNVDTMLCFGESIELSVDWPGSTITWNTGSIGSSIVVNTPGMYWADIEVGTCQYASDTAVINFEICDTCFLTYTQISDELLLGTDSTLCEGDSLTFDINLDIDADIFWNNGQIGNSVMVGTAGEYWATIIYGDCIWFSDSVVVDTEVCIDTCLTLLTFIEENLQLGNDTTICDGDVLNIDLDFPIDAEVVWNSGQMSNSIVVSEPGSYFADVVYGDCTWETDTINIQTVFCPDTCLIIYQSIVNDLLLGNDTLICEGDTVNIDLEFLIDADIFWNTGQVGNSIVITQADNYFADVIYGNCVWETDTINVQTEYCPDTCIVIFQDIVNDLFLGNDTTICEEDELILSIDLGLDADVIWNTGQVGNSIVINSPGVYFADVLYGDCMWQSESITISMESCDPCLINLSQPDLNNWFLGNDTIICENETFTIASNLDPSYSVTWNNGQSGTAIQANQQGIYWATIVVDDCTYVTDSIAIATIDCNPCEYFIPNAFSPNADGSNDLFKVNFHPTGCNLVSFEMAIFDRWGEVIIKTNVNEWDGFFKGKILNSGVYVYWIKMELEKNGELKTVFESGDVTIIK